MSLHKYHLPLHTDHLPLHKDICHRTKTSTTPQIQDYPGLLYDSSLWSGRWLCGVHHSTKDLPLQLIGMYGLLVCRCRDGHDSVHCHLLLDVVDLEL